MVQAIKGWMKRCIPRSAHMSLRIAWTRLRTVTSWPWMRGDRYECPFCRRRFGRFYPEGLRLPVFKEKQITSGGYSEHRRCPWCWSSERDRLLHLSLTQGPPWGSRMGTVLHLAPEFHLQRLLRRVFGIRYVAGDLRSPLAQVKMSVLDLPVRASSIDGIVCNHVLEHVVDDQKAMAELFRALKPGGWAILQVPIGLALERTYEDCSIKEPAARERAFGQFDHVRIYSRNDYRRRLEVAGFEVTIENCLEKFGAKTVERLRLNPLEDLHLCRKPKEVS